MRVSSSGLGFVAVAVAAIAFGGCRATTYGEAEPVGYVELTAAPVDVEAYPHTYYDGRQVYYVNDRWMYRDRGRWAYYRHEPPALYRHRTYVQQAPPAYPQGRYPRAYPQQYPQTYPGGRPPTSAPPAVRVE
jgi:hypothetical protein